MCLSLGVLQHLTGISAVFLYSSDLFAGPNADFRLGIKVTAIVFAVNTFASYSFLAIVDCFGRKRLIVVMYFLKAIALGLLSMFGWLDN